MVISIRSANPTARPDSCRGAVTRDLDCGVARIAPEGAPAGYRIDILMRRDIILALAVAAVLYLAVCLLMFVFQRSLIYYPRPRQVSVAESTMKLAVDGAELVVTVRPHPGPRAIVYFGGNAEDVSLNLASFSKAFPDHALYLMHYRGFGGSSGSPSEAANHADAAALFRSVIAQHADVSVIWAAA